MPEATLDAYADQVALNIGPFGCAVNFHVSQSMPPAGAPGLGAPVATIRMSLEHMKVMAFLFRRQLVQYERQRGIHVPVPQDVLNNLQIGAEDWRTFWEAER